MSSHSGPLKKALLGAETLDIIFFVRIKYCSFIIHISIVNIIIAETSFSMNAADVIPVNVIIAFIPSNATDVVPVNVIIAHTPS